MEGILSIVQTPPDRLPGDDCELGLSKGKDIDQESWLEKGVLEEGASYGKVSVLWSYLGGRRPVHVGWHLKYA